jgi:hypothetical protein
MVTFKLTVSCGAALGLVEETWIWPAAGWVPRNASIAIKAEDNDQQNNDFIAHPTGDFAEPLNGFFLCFLYTDSKRIFPA